MDGRRLDKQQHPILEMIEVRGVRERTSGTAYLDNKGSTGEAQVPVRGPARYHPPLRHHNKTVGIRQSEALAGESLDQVAGLPQLLGVERVDVELSEFRDKAQELDRPALIVPAQEPPMPFGNHQGRSDERRRIRKQVPSNRVVTVGLLEERDQRGSIDVNLSP